MKHPKFPLLVLVMVLSVIWISAYPVSPRVVNRIEGSVYDPNHNPIEDANVELLNDFGSLFARTRTTAVGKFVFLGMPTGRYVVRVIALDARLLPQSQDVLIENATRSDDMVYLDFSLRYDKRKMSGNETPREIVFAQEVPPDAKKLFQEGIAEVGKNQETGKAKFEESLRVFPEYFDALNWLGKVYSAQKDYEKAGSYLTKAVSVNPRSYSAQYGLAFSLYQLKKYKAALEPAKEATNLVSESVEGQLLYGTLLRILEQYPDAEKALKKANTLGNNTNSDVHWQLALLYNRLNRNKDAVTELETFLKLVPDSPDKSKIQDLIAKLKASGNKK